MAPGKVVLVTGCSVGGIGWHLCAALAAQGATVFATARRPEATAGLTELGCRTLQLDVTDSASIGAAVAEVLREAGRIDGTPTPRPGGTAGMQRARWTVCSQPGCSQPAPCPYNLGVKTPLARLPRRTQPQL
jgi:hypothetical protein